MTKTTRMTTAQAIVKFLDNQYVSMDGVETKFVEGFFTIFGHGIAVGLGEALDSNPGGLKVMQGRNEQGMCHTAIAFAKQSNRRRIIACASSVPVISLYSAMINQISSYSLPPSQFCNSPPIAYDLPSPLDLGGPLLFMSYHIGSVFAPALIILEFLRPKRAKLGI